MGDIKAGIISKNWFQKKRKKLLSQIIFLTLFKQKVVDLYCNVLTERDPDWVSKEKVLRRRVGEHNHFKGQLWYQQWGLLRQRGLLTNTLPSSLDSHHPRQSWRYLSDYWLLGCRGPHMSKYFPSQCLKTRTWVVSITCHNTKAFL